MNINAISSAELFNKVSIIANKTSQIAVEYLGKAYEWLSINVPAVMNIAHNVAQKTMIAVKPHLNTLGTWALGHQELLCGSAIGIAAGLTIGYLIYTRNKASA